MEFSRDQWDWGINGQEEVRGHSRLMGNVLDVKRYFPTELVARVLWAGLGANLICSVPLALMPVWVLVSRTWKLVGVRLCGPSSSPGPHPPPGFLLSEC